MDTLKEIFDAMHSRIRSPIFGSIALMFMIFNWKPLFYLAFANASAIEKFDYFDGNTSTWSVFALPIIIGLSFAIAAPWLALLSAWLAESPTTRRKLRQTKSVDTVLTEKLRLEKTRDQLLANEEQALIDAAKRDQEINEIESAAARERLQAQIEELRTIADTRSEEKKAYLMELEKNRTKEAITKEKMAQIKESILDMENMHIQIADLTERRNAARARNDNATAHKTEERIIELQQRLFLTNQGLLHQFRN